MRWYAVLFVSIAVCYALAGGTFANWAVVYLREERAMSEAGAALAAGRLLFTALLARVCAAVIWRALPIAMALGFVALPLVRDLGAAILAFGFAGLGCSAFFPLTVSLASPYFAGGAARASSLLSAALMVGVGLGSFVVGPLREGVALRDAVSVVHDLSAARLRAVLLRAAARADLSRPVRPLPSRRSCSPASPVEPVRYSSWPSAQ